MKFMMMTFGSAESMTASASVEWIREMVAFMQLLDRDLRATGELLDAHGLVDGSEAGTTRMVDGVATPAPGSVSPSVDALVGYWLLDVAYEGRAIEIALGITEKLGVPIEVRRIGEPPVT